MLFRSRPADSRTHVGRFFEKIGNEGPAGFLTVIGRKLSLMIGSFSNTAWVLAVLAVHLTRPEATPFLLAFAAGSLWVGLGLRRDSGA